MAEYLGINIVTEGFLLQLAKMSLQVRRGHMSRRVHLTACAGAAAQELGNLQGRGGQPVLLQQRDQSHAVQAPGGRLLLEEDCRGAAASPVVQVCARRRVKCVACL